MQDLSKKVVSKGYELGIGLDGDLIELGSR
jgi:hypothetical protein